MMVLTMLNNPRQPAIATSMVADCLDRYSVFVVAVAAVAAAAAAAVVVVVVVVEVVVGLQLPRPRLC